MSTTPVPAKPEDRESEQPEPGRRFAPDRARGAAVAAPRGEEPRQEAAPQYPPTDRTVEADLLIDIPQLSVDELSLELEASLMLNRIKLDAKGLEAGLYVKANFDDLAALRREHTSAPRGLRTGLRELLGTTRDGGEDAHEPAAQPAAQAPAAREDDDEPAQNHDGGLGERARHAAGQGLKVAGLTAAGLAGGALLESRGKAAKRLVPAAQKLPLPLPGRRRSPLHTLRKHSPLDTLRKHLP